MKIILDETKKEGVLVKEDGTEISRYTYATALNKNFTIEELKESICKFNLTLGMAEEFDDIKELSKYVKIHNW